MTVEAMIAPSQAPGTIRRERTGRAVKLQNGNFAGRQPRSQPATRSVPASKPTPHPGPEFTRANVWSDGSTWAARSLLSPERWHRAARLLETIASRAIIVPCEVTAMHRSGRHHSSRTPRWG